MLELAALSPGFAWDAWTVGTLFFVAGVVDVVVQGVLIGCLLPAFGEVRVALSGLACEVVAYSMLISATLLTSPVLVLAGTAAPALEDALLTPSVGALISGAVGPREQGTAQGANQSVQALARVFGPYAGGELYGRLGNPAPFFAGVISVSLALAALLSASARGDRRSAREETLGAS